MEKNIIKFNGYTKNKIDVSGMLEEIAKNKPDNAFVICWSNDWKEISFHSSNPSSADNHYMASLYANKVMNGDFYDNEEN